MGQNKDLNILDISKIAGVSKATVSRVLNNSEKVNEKTRKRILDIIKKYDYQPSNLARALSKKQSRIIGVVIEDLANPFFTEIARGIEFALHNEGYIMFLTSSNWNKIKEQEVIRKLYQNQIDGLLITPIHVNTPAFSTIKKNNLPVVLMNYRSEDTSQCFVSSDNILGAEIGTQLLVDNGYEEIICLKGFEHQTAEDRVTGFYKTINKSAKSNIKIRMVTDIFRRKEGYDYIIKHAHYFKNINHTCSIFAFNDFAAFGVIDGLIELGIKVPDEIAVIGYDDIAFAKRYKIPLTTIRQSKYKLGEIAAKTIVNKIHGKQSETTQIILKPELIIRKSCPKKN